MHRLLHFMSPSGHFVRHAASPRRSPSEIAGSWAFASVIVLNAAIQSTSKVIAILWKSDIAAFPCGLREEGVRKQACGTCGGNAYRGGAQKSTTILVDGFAGYARVRFCHGSILHYDLQLS
jgi:hypothetical protein